MMYYTILASFFLLGMASSQKIDTLTACLTKEQNLFMNGTFTPKQGTAPVSCVYKNSVQKVVAATDTSITVDSTYKNRATVSRIGNSCLLDLTGFSNNEPEKYTFIIYQENVNSTTTITVEKGALTPCSNGNVLKNGGVILLLAFILPLLFDMQ